MIKPYTAVALTPALLLAMLTGAAAEESGAAYLSPLEQGVLKELNLARSNPQRYAEFLADMRPYFHGNQLERPGEPVLITREGVAAVDEAISFLRAARPMSMLRLSRGLSLAAKRHVKDQRSGAIGHTGSDGSQPWDRMNRYGTWQGEVAENIAYGVNTARDVVIQLIVDDGVPGRGHRLNMFHPYRFVGVGCGRHGRLGTVCVQDYAAGYVENGRP